VVRGQHEDVGAVPDIITHAETGLLCPPGDPAALADALRAVVSDPALRGRLGRAAQSFHREHLDAPAFVQRLKSIWREAAGTTAASSSVGATRPARQSGEAA
jgi:glycosyltransferase involved in cell wall biosynthesis